MVESNLSGYVFVILSLVACWSHLLDTINALTRTMYQTGEVALCIEVTQVKPRVTA